MVDHSVNGVNLVVDSGTPRPKPGSSGIVKSMKPAKASGIATKQTPKVVQPVSSRSPALVGSGGSSSSSGGGASSAELKAAQEDIQKLATENQRLQDQVRYWSDTSGEGTSHQSTPAIILYLFAGGAIPCIALCGPFQAKIVLICKEWLPGNKMFLHPRNLSVTKIYLHVPLESWHCGVLESVQCLR